LVHKGQRIPCPRGKMLGGTSNMHYMQYVRGNPADFDFWAAEGATGWAYNDVLKYFKKGEQLNATGDFDIDWAAHSTKGEASVATRKPIPKAALVFVQAAQELGHPKADYNGTNRGGDMGCCSLTQHSITVEGRRADSYSAYLKEQRSRSNLTICTCHHARRVLFEGTTAVGVETSAGESISVIKASKEVIVCCGAIKSPQLLLLSGVGPRVELQKHGISCVVDLDSVGRGLKDHPNIFMLYQAPGIGLAMNEVVPCLGPDALRAPIGPLPKDPNDDSSMANELKELKKMSEDLVAKWEQTGDTWGSSSLGDALLFYSTGLGDTHTQDCQITMIAAGYAAPFWQSLFGWDVEAYFKSPEDVDTSKELIFLVPILNQMHSVGSVQLASNDPMAEPLIDYAYYTDPHDLAVMKHNVLHTIELASKMGMPLRNLHVPYHLAKNYPGYEEKEELPDKLLEEYLLHYTQTTYHPACTCRIGLVVDPALKVIGTSGLRVADASVMPMITAGNLHATCLMIGEKVAEMIAGEHTLKLGRTAATDGTCPSCCTC